MSTTRLTEDQHLFVTQHRIGRLATADRQGHPHVIPVCYAFEDATFYIALDAKPKRVEPAQLKRVRNILENPRAALVIDRYSDDWSQLAYLLVRGSAALVAPQEDEHRRAIVLLQERYPRYQQMPIEHQPVIALRVESVVAWGALP